MKNRHIILLFFILFHSINAQSRSFFTKENLVFFVGVTLMFFAGKQFEEDLKKRTISNGFFLLQEIKENMIEKISLESDNDNDFLEDLKKFYNKAEKKIQKLRSGYGYPFHAEQLRNQILDTVSEKAKKELKKVGEICPFDDKDLSQQKRELEICLEWIPTYASLAECGNIACKTSKYIREKKSFDQSFQEKFPKKAKFDQLYKDVERSLIVVKKENKNKKLSPRTESFIFKADELMKKCHAFSQYTKNHSVSYEAFSSSFDVFKNKNQSLINQFQFYTSKDQCLICSEESNGSNGYGLCSGNNLLCKNCFLSTADQYVGRSFCCPFCRGVIKKNAIDVIISCAQVVDKKKPEQKPKRLIEKSIDGLKSCMGDEIQTAFHITLISNLLKSNFEKIVSNGKWLTCNETVTDFDIKLFKDINDFHGKETVTDCLQFMLALQNIETAENFNILNAKKIISKIFQQDVAHLAFNQFKTFIGKRSENRLYDYMALRSRYKRKFFSKKSSLLDKIISGGLFGLYSFFIATRF